ncbi:HET-domain-containing protein [Ophiobolus disseminans]|uniref:HET-domain-containing protein n=1 Tax=Ophiobolus disseminans TaxID=1469910 RepID=A0A6A7A570_9PLEO|nr:HET-domain-containing protein [Ophiobolus disseminans]
MRLLNTSTLLLEGFMTKPPPYAILSHTWVNNEEYIFEDLHNGTGQEKSGYEKVKTCCQLAASEGYQYAWIDTCCIDKSSSAELSEAINSMFAWYRDSDTCYVYLDVDIEADYLTAQDLTSSRWIHRGWTLQELIAPARVQFYSRFWMFLGTRQQLTLPLHEATKIDIDVLYRSNQKNFSLSKFTVAKKMSWAAERETTRPEDVAYSLFGLFDVHLPPLYGEGSTKAFLRLQEEILRSSVDLSILACTFAKLVHRLRQYRGVQLICRRYSREDEQGCLCHRSVD